MKKLFAILLLPVFTLTACSPEESVQEATPPDPVVKTMDLSESPEYEITEIGTLKAAQEVDLMAQAAGTVSELSVNVGDSVTANQILAVIGANEPNGQAQIALENAQLQLQNAEQNLGSNKANNLDAVTKAQFRVQSLNATLDKLNRNLNELLAQNANAQTSLELQKNTLSQNTQLADTTYSNLLTQFNQSENDLMTNAKTTLDGIFVNLDTHFANINSLLNPDDLSSANTSDLNSALGSQNYGELLDAVDTYNNYHWNLKSAKSNYQNELPLDESNFEWVVTDARQRLDEMRILLAEVREMLNASMPDESFPSTILDGYKGMISGAEAQILGDLMKLDTLSQSLATLRLEKSNKIASTQANQVTVNNQLSEADNALQKLNLSGEAAIKDLQSQIQQTHLEMQSAQQDLNTAARTAGLQNNGKDLEINTLKNQVRLAQDSLDNNKVTSVIDGVISELSIENGDYVSPGTRIGTLVQLSQVSIVFYLNQENAARIFPGQTIEFTAANSPQEHQAIITKIAPSADPMTKKFQVEASLANDTGVLKPGAFVNIHLDLTAGVFDPSKVYIPMNAVIFGQNEKYVYVIENEMAIKRPIEIGQIYGEWVEVLSGLNSSDLLIIDGQRNLPPEGNVKVNYGQNPTSNDSMTNDQSSQNTNDQTTDSNETVDPEQLLNDADSDDSISNEPMTNEPMTNDQLGTSNTNNQSSGDASNSDLNTDPVNPSDQPYPIPENAGDLGTSSY